jgi:hypothetical protein
MINQGGMNMEIFMSLCTFVMQVSILFLIGSMIFLVLYMNFKLKIKDMKELNVFMILLSFLLYISVFNFI